MTRPRYSGPRFSGASLIGILLIIIGGAYLLRNAGFVDVDWSELWPLFLVVLGLFVIAGALTARGRASSGTTVVPREGARSLDLDVGIGAGAFRIGAGASELVEVLSNGDDVRSRTDRRGEQARVELRQDAPWFPFGWHGQTRWDVRIAPDVPVALAVNGGAGDFTIDMGGLVVRGARISLGAAQISVVLPVPTGQVRVSVTSGASSITIRVPPGVEAKVTTSGFLSVSGRNETPGFLQATNRVLVDVTGGASSVRIV